MNSKTLKACVLSVAFVAVMLLAGCSKKVAKVTPPAPPSPPAPPTATLAANPSVIQQGQSTVLTWQTGNATDITISGLGTVPSSGSRSVTPNMSTTYNLVAKGPGGNRDASARVTVNEKIAKGTPFPTDEELFAKNVKDVFFDFDKSNVRPNEVATAGSDAAFLTQHPTVRVMIEGHCDDRGSVEYNLALGTSRAESVKQSLQQQGVSPSQLKTISYGKEKPFCEQDNEHCWQQNRVDHFVFQH